MDKLSGVEKLSELINQSNDVERALIERVIECISEIDGADLNSSFLDNLITDYLSVAEKLEKVTNEVDYLIEFDELTMCYDHKRFKERLQYEIARKNRYKYNLSVVYIDLDGLKDINEKFGFKAGDQVLDDVGYIIKGFLREVDVVSRWIGKDYVVLLPETDLGACLIIAERLKTLIEAYTYKESGMVTAGFGVTEYEKDDDEQKLIHKAQEYLFETKAFGADVLPHH